MEVNAAPQLLGYKHSSRYIPVCAVNYDRISFLGELTLYNIVFSKANLEMSCANVFVIALYIYIYIFFFLLLLFFFVAVFILGMVEETNAVRWMISLEGRVICECVQSSFLTALATLFAVYYVFNLQYQEEASCTLEFLQRCDTQNHLHKNFDT